MVAQKREHDVHHKRRHGLHQKQTKHFMRTYLPYLPLVSIVGFGLAISNIWQTPLLNSQQGDVLSYATNTTISGLLSETNAQRGANGRPGLALRSELNQAAQAKANDMATRNYWSHLTPEGAQPWIFLDQVNYSYTKAGENLAYGFLTSTDTIAGWMNSPAHKDNMLDSDFTEVGFGFANNDNYQSSGQQTVVVAMYGKPVTAAAAAPVSAPSSSKPAVKNKSVTQAAPSTPVETTAPVEVAETPEADADTVVPPNTEKPITTSTPTSISRVQALTDGRAPWSVFAVGLLSGFGLLYLVFKHGLAFRRVVVEGERFIMHHALFDVTIVSLVIVGFILTRTVGTIL
jgi:uncharacterized protein YkwD